jgi:hypothetical protein
MNLQGVEANTTRSSVIHSLSLICTSRAFSRRGSVFSGITASLTLGGGLAMLIGRGCLGWNRTHRVCLEARLQGLQCAQVIATIHVPPSPHTCAASLCGTRTMSSSTAVREYDAKPLLAWQSRSARLRPLRQHWCTHRPKLHRSHGIRRRTGSRPTRSSQVRSLPLNSSPSPCREKASLCPVCRGRKTENGGAAVQPPPPLQTRQANLSCFIAEAPH